MKFSEIVENKKFGFFFILLLSIFIRILYFLHFKENPFFYFIHDTSDAINFDIGAQNFSSGDLLASAPNNSYAPLYKYFVGIIYFLTGRNLAVVWGIQLLLGTITVLLVFLIASKLFNNRAALISAILYAFYGTELMYEGILLRASLITFLGVFSLYLLIKLEEKNSFIRIIITGFVISLFIQCRPNVIIVFFLFLFIPPCCMDKKNIRKIISLSLFVLLFFIPLLVQAYVVHGKFVFFDASGPLTILMGNNPEYPGADYLPEFRYPGDTSLTFKEIVSVLIGNLINYPADMITLYLRKFYYFFNSYEFPTNYNFYIFQEFSFLLKTPFPNFAVFSSLGLMGFLVNIQDFKRLRFLNVFIIGMSLSVILFYVVSRFRVPVVPYYAIFAGSFLDRIGAWYLFRKYKNILFSVAVFITIQLLFNSVPDTSQTNKSNDYGNLGNAYLNTGDVQNAIGAYEKSLKIDPNNFYTHNNLGKIYAEKNNFPEAVEEFKKAIEFNPGQWEPYYNLGLAYMKSTQLIKAQKVLSVAQKLAPQEAQVLFGLGNLYENMGRFEQSIKYYKKYISLSKDDWKGYFYIGNILSRLSSYKSAIQEYKKSKKLNSRHSQTLVNLGNAYSNINRPDLAINEYLLALSLNIQDPVIHRNIGVLYTRKDFYSPLKAVYHLQKSLELDPNQNAAESVKNLINQLKKS